jgi:hypothetical protein
MPAAVATSRRSWGKEDDLRLTAMFRVRLSRAWMAKSLSRPIGEIDKRLSYLGLIERDEPKSAYNWRAQIPRWVPERLHEEYDAVAFEEGEEAAARWARGELGLNFRAVIPFRSPAPVKMPSHIVNPTVRCMMHRVCWLHGVDAADVMGHSRIPMLVLARQHFVWLLRRQTPLSLIAIGKIIGRDHTTIMHAINKIDAEIRRRREARKASR